MQSLYKLGSILIFGLKLQGYFLWQVLLGGVIFGIFPAILSLYRIVYKCIEEKSITELDLRGELKKTCKSEFKKINLLGYLFLMGSLVLMVNLNISQYYIRNGWIHAMLLIIAILVSGTALFSFPIFAKYELSFKQYLLQSLLFFVLNIFESIAILLGVTICLFICLLFPIIGVCCSVPFVLFPYVWFSRLGVQKVEATLCSEEV